MTIEKWGLFEISLKGKKDGNPFVDYDIKAVFSHNAERKTVEGFYDGDGTYIVRFMPSYEGDYNYVISGSFSDEITTGSFTAIAPTANNHGPVRVSKVFKNQLVYADGTPHYSFGTTCYAFDMQKDEIVENTFKELKKGYFNKMRFCVMPKHYDFCLYDPVCFPYEGTPVDCTQINRSNFWQFNGNPAGNDWDFKKFNPEFFRNHDKTVRRLMNMGIEADMILFHAYDRWGFSKMPMEDNLLYVRYMMARYSAFRNVWWALANEYELLYPLQEPEFERLAAEATGHDPYHHLISIHNCEAYYDYSKPWITHCSCQRCDHYRTTESTGELIDKYGKPVVWDEVGYEGDFPHCWGNFTPQELVRRSWEAILRGGYCGHSETFLSDDDIIWWAHGNVLKGESAKRFKFMQDFMKSVPGCGLKEGKLRDDFHFQWDDKVAIPADKAYEGQYYFFYYSFWQPTFRQIYIDDTTWFDVDVIDTYDMTITSAGRHKGCFSIPLPKKQYMGIRCVKSKNQND